MKPTDEQIEDVRARWGLEGDIRFRRRVANFVYESSRGGSPVILRLTEPAHRRREEIEAELDWMSFLSTEGVRLARPIQSRSGARMEVVGGTASYHAAVFEWASGRMLADADLDERMIQSWGAYLGRMHRATRRYLPGPGVATRQDWDRDDILLSALRSLDPADRPAYDRMNEILEWMRSLPQPETAYGLVHGDLHRGNFFVDEKGITAFDFDDSCRHWFVYDLVPPLFSILKDAEDGGSALKEESVLESFLAGYRAQHELEAQWWKRLEGFKRYRAVLVYHWIKTGLAEGIFDEKGRTWARRYAPWCLEYLKRPWTPS